MNGWACLGLFAVGVIVTGWLLYLSPPLPVDTPEADA